MIVEEVLYGEEQGYVGLYHEPKLGWVATVKLHQWSPSEFRRYLVIWGAIMNELRARGIKEVFGLCIDEKNAKFNELFGFVYFNKFVECEDDTIRKVMRLEL